MGMVISKMDQFVEHKVHHSTSEILLGVTTLWCLQ